MLDVTRGKWYTNYMFSDKPMIIYFVTFEDEVVYIGQTKLSLKKRRVQHEYNATRQKGYIIGSAIRKHGTDKFTWNVHSVYYNQVDLDAAEKHYIAKYKPRYNINLGGEARGLRKSNGKPAWNKNKSGLQTAWNKGRKETRPEVIEKIRQSAKNRKFSSRKINDTQREAMNEGRRQALRILDKRFICHENQRTYVLVIDAAKELNIPANGIYAVLNVKHKMKSYKGFTFSYI